MITPDYDIIPLIEEDTPIDSRGKLFETEYPPDHMIHEVIASFDGELRCKIIIGEEDYELELETNVPSAIPIAGESETVTAFFEGDGTVFFASISFLGMHALPVALDKSILHFHPEQGISVMLDFTDALSEAAGWDEVIDKHVQLRTPGGAITNIKRSSANFQWRENRLYCYLPCGQEYKIRICYQIENEEWTEWSDWLTIKPRRKMSL